MSLENDDKRARTRSKSIRGEQLIIPLRGEVAPGLPAHCLFQKGFGSSGPGFKLHTLPLLQPHRDLSTSLENSQLQTFTAPRNI